MRVVITSDFHIKYFEKEEDIERRNRVENFLKSLIGKIDCLILAGDIFDLWLEWNTVIIKNYFNVLKILADLRVSGCKIIFLMGNHDFLLDRFLTDFIGCEIYENFYESEINGKKIYVSHGDLFTQNDIRYRVFRMLVRSRFSKWLCRILHPNIILKWGVKLSRTSRENNDFDKKQKRKMTVKREQGLIDKAVLLSNDYDIIVFGHSHIPVRMEINNSIYLNCGDWVSNNSFVFFDEEICILKKETTFEN